MSDGKNRTARHRYSPDGRARASVSHYVLAGETDFGVTGPVTLGRRYLGLHGARAAQRRVRDGARFILVCTRSRSACGAVIVGGTSLPGDDDRSTASPEPKNTAL
jgi:hypothetical protein